MAETMELAVACVSIYQPGHTLDKSKFAGVHQRILTAAGATGPIDI